MSAPSCSKCRTTLPVHAETCVECGHRILDNPVHYGDEDGETTHSFLHEYKLLQLLGSGVIAVGAIAALADSPIAATVTVMIGVGIYIAGLLGRWWNTGN